jgi:hypothetical protein
MKKEMFAFTKDYIACIAHASLFTYQRDERVMDANDALFGVWQFTQKKPFKTMFWKFLGIQKHQIMKEIMTEMYTSLKKIPEHSRLKFQLDGSFQERFLALKKQGVKKFTFLVLLYAALDSLSDELVVTLHEQGISLPEVKTKLEKIIMMLDKVDLSPIEFFTMLHQMMHSMGLQADQMDMFMDIGQLQDMKDAG